MNLHLRPCVVCDNDRFWMQTTDGATLVRFRLHRLQSLLRENPPEEIRARCYPPGDKIDVRIDDVCHLLKAACEHELRGPRIKNAPPRDSSGRFALAMADDGSIHAIDVAASGIPFPS